VTVHRDTGPIADEAAQFAAAALGWAQRMAGSIDPDRIATGAPECTGCPVCRTIHALRDPGPEFADRLTRTVTDLATTIATGLRHAFDGHHPGGGDAPADTTDSGKPAPGFQRIDIA
jgi:hypothetical protein